MSASCKPASCWIYAYRAISIVPFGILVRYLFYRIVELSVTQRVVVLFNVNFDCDLLFKLLSFYLLLFWLYDLSSVSILTTVCRKSLKNITKTLRNETRHESVLLTLPAFYETVEHPSVCLSVCLSLRLSVPSINSSSGVRRVCCRAPCGQEISINSAAARRSAANADSVTFTAAVGGWSLTCFIQF